MFKYFLNDTQYTPLNEGDFTFDIELKTDSGAYHYEKTLNGTVLFDGAAYEYIKAHSDTQKILFKIYEVCEDGDFLIFNHALYFTNRDCYDDEDKKQITITLKADSYFQKLLDAIDINFNFLEVSNIVSTFYSPDAMRWEYKAATVAQPAFFICSMLANAGLANPYAPFTVYIREVKTTYCLGGVPQPPSGTGWTLLLNNCEGRSLATWYRCPPYWSDIPSLPNANRFDTTIAIFPAIPPTPAPTFFVSDWVKIADLTNGGFNVSFWIDQLLLTGTPVTLDNGRLLVDVINFRLFRIDQNLALQSNLLFDLLNPVTGVSPSDLYQVQMHAIRDIKDPAATEPATIENTNLKEIFEGYIQGKLNAFWRVDENTGRVIIEHYQDLSNGKTFDLNTYAEYKLKNKYQYDNSDIPKAEEFPSLDSSVDFTGVDIIYENAVSTGKKAYNTDKFYSEVESIIQDPATYSNAGIVIITPDSLAPIESITPSGERAEIGAITGDYSPNAPQGMANLHKKYWNSYRPFKNGNMNLTPTQFVDNRPVKKLDPITIPMCCFSFFDPYADFIGENFTEGKLQKASFSPKTNQITLDINY